MSRYENCTYFYTLYNAVNNCFPAVSNEDIHTILREVILAPSDYTVEFNDFTYSQSEIYSLIAHDLIQSCMSEQTKEKTYIDFIENASNVIKHMNDGYVSDNDYAERSSFLDDTARYEFILFSALAFLKAAEEDDALLYGELKLNIIRFREINDLVKNFTRDEKNIDISREEFEQARPIYRMLKSLQNLGYKYNFSPKERAGLGIDHDDDEDLTDAFNYGNWIKRMMLLQLRLEIGAENMQKPMPQTNEQQLIQPLSDEHIVSKIAQLRGANDKRGFDKNRFYVLEGTHDSIENKKGN